MGKCINVIWGNCGTSSSVCKLERCNRSDKNTETKANFKNNPGSLAGAPTQETHTKPGGNLNGQNISFWYSVPLGSKNDADYL